MLYANSANQVLRRDQYGYDLAGNRLYDRVFQVPYSTYHDNDRSWAYGYDSLHRLISASMGSLSADNSSIQPAGGGAPVPRTTTWNLDNLGNWTRAPEAHGRQISGDFNGDGEPESFWEDHVVNAANEIVQLNYGSMDPADPVSFLHDPAGNLAFDGQYVYQYDAWNRLIQVNLPGIEPLHAEDAYRVVSADQLSDLVCRYTYDGLGRLIIKETPVQTGPTYLQRKDFYYDGVRRIQETIYRPDLVPGTGGGGQGGGALNDESPVAVTDDEQQIMQPPPAAHYYWTDRDYVYGPDYVDEFVCQLPENGAAFYMLQDANFNVVALCNSQGVVVEQYAYEPYGNIVAVDSFTTDHPVNRVGHQGLFFERFDGSYTDPSIAAGVAGLYYNRNRFYSPTLGRFTTRDPNETGMPILIALAMNGEALSAALGGFEALSHYADGMNAYVYLGNNPINARDALGLDDDFDDAISDQTGYRVAALGYIQEASGWVLVGTNTAVNLAGSILGVDLIQSAGNILSGNAGFWDYVEVGASVTGVGMAAWKSFKWANALTKNARRRAILKANMAIGAEFESFVFRSMGWRKNTQRVYHGNRYAIPDVLHGNEVIDIKSEIEISLDRQLRIIGEWAKANGVEAKLIVSNRNKKIYGPVHKYFKVQVFGE